jgi:hypothetical protein
MCQKCGDVTHETNNCTLRIRIPRHVKMEWTCPDCDMHYESITPAMSHEYICSNLLTSLTDQIYARLRKRLRTPQESPKKSPVSQKK